MLNMIICVHGALNICVHGALNMSSRFIAITMRIISDIITIKQFAIKQGNMHYML